LRAQRGNPKLESRVDFLDSMKGRNVRPFALLTNINKFAVLILLKPGHQFLTVTEHGTEQDAWIAGHQLEYCLLIHFAEIRLQVFIRLALDVYQFLDGGAILGGQCFKLR